MQQRCFDGTVWILHRDTIHAKHQNIKKKYHGLKPATGGDCEMFKPEDLTPFVIAGFAESTAW
jgi:hypothetical protein